MALCAVLVAGMAGCSGGGSQSGVTGGVKPSSPEEAVQNFFDARTKHGTLTFISGKERKEDRIEYWFDGDRYRLTWFNEDGSVRIHMISPDGEKLYFCYTEDEVCVISYTLPEMHQWIFNGPPDWTPGEGMAEGDATVYTYTAEKLWDVEGASQQFYLEDLVVYADDTRILKTVVRTNSQKVAEEELVTSDYVFDEPEIGVEIPEEVFELPYEIGERE